MNLKAGGAEAIRNLHCREADRLKEKVARDSQKGWAEVMKEFKTDSYRSFKHVHKAECVAAVLRGDRYRAALHRHWSETKELPALEDVRLDYLYGNSFTEEPRRGASHVRGRCCTGE